MSLRAHILSRSTYILQAPRDNNNSHSKHSRRLLGWQPAGGWFELFLHVDGPDASTSPHSVTPVQTSSLTLSFRSSRDASATDAAPLGLSAQAIFAAICYDRVAHFVFFEFCMWT
ncbi:hypothetical protein VCV18_008816 [Metarhizium anisopliae]